ncbi:MFS transporter [Roseomonas mucosa]|uniref:MFS transporter n=1 Tax=Roseomonas mucosa TaxID=207340 RepID=UPI0015C569D2|nr:MFS transporter [Roseomonas mucosa]
MAAFVAQTCEYLPISVMPAIRDNLALSESAVGSLVTGYAWIAALTATPLTMLTITWDRKALFLILLAVIATAGATGAIAPDYGLLAVSRVLMALAHGVFWAMLAVLGIRLAPHIPRARVLSTVFAGTSLAGVAGVPLAALIGQIAGWRWAFAIFALVAVALAITGLLALPRTPSGHTASKPIHFLGSHRLRAVVAATAIVVAGHFCSYTYIVPLLQQAVGAQTAFVPVLLFVFGAAGAIGAFLSGWARLSATHLAIVATIGIAISQAMSGLAEGPYGLAPILALWGASTAALVVGLQGAAIESVPDNADMASALYVAAFNLGIGGGAVIGGLLTMIAPSAALLWIGAALTATGLVPLIVGRPAPGGMDARQEGV